VSPRLEACVIGAGPRGLSVLERLCAHVRASAPDRPVQVHLVDPYPPGAGGVWRTDQSRQLLMNTVASQVSMFTDASVPVGAREPGPSLYEWANFLTLMGPFDGYDGEVLADVRALGPDSYPTRALNGQYLEWVFRRVVGTAPDTVTVRVYPSRAVALDDAADGTQTVRLADGTLLTGLDSVVLALGHVPAALTADQARLRAFAAAHGRTYIPPANPADVYLDGLAAAQPVVLRGLGLTFFDYLALLTVGRGGCFQRGDNGLVYRASGREPRLYAGSRRGVPYHARGDNQKGADGRYTPAVLTPDVIADLRRRAPLRFRADIWPLIAKDVETCYYAALLRARRSCGCTAERFTARYLDCAWGGARERRLLTEYKIPGELRWDWDRVARPYTDKRFAGVDEFRSWLLDYLRHDVADARAGNVSGPRKAALDVLRDLRNEVRLLVDHGGLTGASHRADLDGWYTPLNAFLSIGPPIQRVEEMIALIEAGVLTVLPPGIRVGTDPDTGMFAVSCTHSDETWQAVALVDARLPDPDLRRTVDPLLRHLLDTDQCRPYRIDSHETGGLDVTRRPFHLVDAAGRPHPHRFAYGVPTEAVHWVTAAGARPGVNSVMFGDSDAIARAVLAIGVVEAVEPADHAAQPEPAATPATSRLLDRSGDHLVDR
jgi:uncharacterized NAD(P)/FAD-binding protein YdhS